MQSLLFGRADFQVFEDRGKRDELLRFILEAYDVELPDMPSEGANLYPIAYGDFRRFYVLVDRIVMEMLRDPYTQATSGNIRFVMRKRLGGQVVLPEAVRKLKCSA